MFTSTNNPFWIQSGEYITAQQHLASEFKVHLEKQLGFIPSTGYIAGSFTANFIINKFYPESAFVANDIDHFLPDFTNHLTQSQILEYSGLLVKIIGVEKKGQLNIISIDGHGLTVETLLDAFDINLCQAAYDCSTGKLHVTNSLIEFLNTKEMQVTRLDTPLFTAIRILRKHTQLQVKCNVDLELHLLTQASGIKELMKDQISIKKEQCEALNPWLHLIQQHMTVQITDTHIVLTPPSRMLLEFKGVKTSIELKDALDYARDRSWSATLDI